MSSSRARRAGVVGLLLAVTAALGLVALGLEHSPLVIAPGVAQESLGPYTDAQGDELRRRVCTACHVLRAYQKAGRNDDAERERTAFLKLQREARTSRSGSQSVGGNLEMTPP